MAIDDQYAPAVLEELSPNGGWSKAGYDEHAVDVRIRDRQPSRRIRLGESPRSYAILLMVVLARVSCVSHRYSTLLLVVLGGFLPLTTTADNMDRF
jgi:hypothetical protein